MADKKLIQQGDVLFFLQEEGTTVPSKAKPLEKDPRGAVFAEGEATGHFHGTTAQDIEMYRDSQGTLWAEVGAKKEVTHQEHGTVILDPGTYRIGIVQEIDPFTKEIQDVID